MERDVHGEHLLILALVLAGATCASPRTHAPPPTADSAVTDASRPVQGEVPRASAQPTAPPWSEGRTLASNAGAYRVVYRSSPASIPRGEVYALEVWVFDAHDATHPLTDVGLTVDAAMPEHQHGMNRRPVIHPGTGGEFQVEGLLFHMSGRWELYFDITRGAITERAQVSVELL
jgi:hypothetical protein